MKSVAAKLTNSQIELLNLQFLRGAAAMFVVADHFLERLTKRGMYSNVIRDFGWELGKTGVYVFFAISGFIMVYTTFEKFDKHGAGWLFLKKRYLRVAPLYYVMTAVMIVFTYLTKSPHVIPPISEIFLSLAFIPYVSTENLTMPVYTLGWTLEYEMFFYLLFALFMSSPPRRGLTLIVVALCAIVGLGFILPGHYENDQFMSTVFHYFSQPILVYFAVGILYACLYRRWDSTNFPRISNALTCLVAVSILIWPAINPSINEIWPVVIAFGLVILFSSPTWNGRFSRFSRLLGDVSYSMYLTHSFILGALAWAFSRSGFNSALSLIGFVAIASISSFVIAYLSWRFVEVPISQRLSGAGTGVTIHR